MNMDLNSLRIDPEKRRPVRSEFSVWKTGGSFILAALVVLAGYKFLWVDTIEETALSAPLASDEILPTGAPSAPEELIVSGYVVAHHKIEVGSKVMGKVAWVGVEKGDQVEMGQLLVRLDNREYVARLNEAKAVLEAAEARLAELEAGSRPEEIERARAELARAEVEATNSSLELKRLQKLKEQSVASAQAVDNARARMEANQATVRVAETSYQLLKIGPRVEQIEQARAEKRRAEAQVEYAESLLDATEIRAPIKGTVLRRIVDTGEMVTTSFAGDEGAKSSVVALADLSDLQVELDISQSDFNRISADQDCRMRAEAFPDRVYRCQIAEISPEANRQKATIQVKVQILEPDDFLRPEMNARVEFSTVQR
jgi:HlyD family secretion protein